MVYVDFFLNNQKVNDSCGKQYNTMFGNDIQLKHIVHWEGGQLLQYCVLCTINRTKINQLQNTTHTN